MACQDTCKLVDMHRVVKEVLEKLVFSCPKCEQVKRTYAEIQKHVVECQGKIDAAALQK
jgi:hypothetical protein